MTGRDGDPVARRLGLDDEGAGLDPRDAADAAEADAALLPLASLAPPADPPPGLWDAIEARIDAEPKPGEAPMGVGRFEDAEWELRADKVWKRVLSADPATGRSVYLLRCDPGAVIPSHKHARDETALLIEGEAWVGATRLRPGDVQVSRAGTVHEEVVSPAGCLLLIAA